MSMAAGGWECLLLLYYHICLALQLCCQIPSVLWHSMSLSSPALGHHLCVCFCGSSRYPVGNHGYLGLTFANSNGVL